MASRTQDSKVAGFGYNVVTGGRKTGTGNERIRLGKEERGKENKIMDIPPGRKKEFKGDLCPSLSFTILSCRLSRSPADFKSY
jgi:hypothetical protein